MNKEAYKKIEKNQSMRDIAYKILKINGKPMDYKDISTIMIDDVGYFTKGETPSATLNSEIGRDDRFLKYRGIVELKEWKHPTNDEPKTPEKSQCPNCEKEILKDFKICPYCEFALEYYCKNCDTKIEPDWKVCPYCGTKKKINME